MKALEMIVTGVFFGEDQVQIQYMEARNQSPSGSLEESLTVQLDGKTAALVEEIKEALVDVVDQYKLSLRNPPDALHGPGGNRFLEDDDD